MDAFYAAVEQRDNPVLKGKPVIVGGHSERGVVSTCSYEAREFGVRSAIPMFRAKLLCPNAVIIPVNMEKYKAASREIFKIFYEYTPLVEPLSIDEAFLDVTGCDKVFGSAQEIGRQIKDRIKTENQLTASVGVSYNKHLAKLASDMEKPDGFKVISEEEAVQLLEGLPIQELWGVGKKTAQNLNNRAIKTIGQLRKLAVQQLRPYFGKNAEAVYLLARGIDNRPVISDEEVKSIGNETTLEKDVWDSKALKQILLPLAEKVARRARLKEIRGRTITLKLRYHDFATITRSVTLAKGIDSDLELYRIAEGIFEKEWNNKAVRLIGLTLSNLESGQCDEQLSLFSENVSNKQAKIDSAVDKIKDRFGDRSVFRGTID